VTHEHRLGIIPNDPIDLYLSAGYGAGWLRAYFNPARFFDKVYSLSPYEQVDGALVDVIPHPTPEAELRRAIRRLKVDIVRAYGGSHPSDIACRNKVNGVPVVVSVHDTSTHMLHDSIADADVVLCVSDAVRKLVSTKFLRDDRLWILPNRVDFSVMRPRGPEETAHLDAKYPFKHRILHIGRRSVQKNLDNLIRAVGILGSDYCLIASGKGPLDQYARLASEQGVLDRCFFLDSISNLDLPLYFSWASCMCNPSRWEGMSIVLIEALASGAILVASDIPEISESVHHGENGLLVRDYENAAAIAATIRTACTDDGVRQTLRANAPPSVAQFERSKIDALEAGYYQKTLDLQAAGAFDVPLQKRVYRSAGRQARRVLPTPVKDALKPFLGR
jgi:glycosyltransferase involved in cell wall biosynthesis